METKPRILYLKKILEERTDEEHPLSTTQLINILNDEYGISAHRTTVTKDIAALQEFGMDIVTIHSTQSKYFVASRKFELVCRERLLAAGFTEAEYARLHAPIGLPIGAETPEEIAVSVAAELIGVRAGKLD